jgi:uncharacterized YccA/Bax inhibitor family protein
MRFRGENPIYSRASYNADYSDQATYKGVFTKTALLLLVTAIVAYGMALNVSLEISFYQLIIGLFVSPILAIIFVIMAHRNPPMAFIYSFLYAIFEGSFLGLLSLMVAIQVGSDAILFALGGTFGTLFVMLFLYGTRIIRVGNGLRSFLFTALISVFFLGFISFVLLIGFGDAFYFSNFYMAIVVFSVLISALYLLYDFRRIEDYVSGGAARENEWSLSLGLITTIVWLYIEILRLILILSRRR